MASLEDDSSAEDPYLGGKASWQDGWRGRDSCPEPKLKKTLHFIFDGFLDEFLDLIEWINKWMDIPIVVKLPELPVAEDLAWGLIGADEEDCAEEVLRDARRTSLRLKASLGSLVGLDTCKMIMTHWGFY